MFSNTRQGQRNTIVYSFSNRFPINLLCDGSSYMHLLGLISSAVSTLQDLLEGPDHKADTFQPLCVGGNSQMCKWSKMRAERGAANLRKGREDSGLGLARTGTDRHTRDIHTDTETEMHTHTSTDTHRDTHT